ncbi:MAG: hypothetical protein AB8I08_26155 [Sandaracinaceae bacterium]
MARRTLLLSGALAVGCAMLPVSDLVPAQVHYIVETDWEGVPLVDGERVFETDLGYTVGVSSFQIHTTSIELIPCEDRTAAWDPRPARAFAHGSTYEHDISAVEPSVLDDVMVEQALDRGQSLAVRATYCELFTTHGSGSQEAITSITGWVRIAGAEEATPFVAEHPLGLAELTPLPAGVSNDALLPDEAEIIVTRLPARAFDGLELDSMPSIDLAYEVSRALLETRQVRWSIGRAPEGEP